MTRVLRQTVSLVLLAASMMAPAGAQAPARVITAHHTNGTLETFGYTRMQTARMSTRKPPGVTKEPVYANPPLYVVLSFGDRPLPVVVVLDESDEQATLYVDANANGDLTDDAKPALREKTVQPEERARLMKVWIHYHFIGQAPAAYADGVADTLGVRFMVYGKICRDRNNVPPDLVYWRDYYRTGNVTLAGKTYCVGLVDDNSDGRYDSPPDSARAFKGDTIFVDRDGNGRFDRALEGFSVREPFNVDGVTYEVREIDPRGASLAVVNSDRDVPPRVAAKRLQAGEAAPDFEIPGVGRLSGLRGKVVLIDFWATWCIPCRAELPNVHRVYDRHRRDGFEVVSVSIDEAADAAKLAAAVTEERITWPSVHDVTRRVRTAYAVTAVPATFLIASDGRIAATDVTGATLETAVASATAGRRRFGDVAVRPGARLNFTIRWIIEDGYYLDEKTTSSLAFTPPAGISIAPRKIATSGRIIGVAEQTAALRIGARVAPGIHTVKADAVIFFCSLREQWCKRVTRTVTFPIAVSRDAPADPKPLELEVAVPLDYER